MAEEKTEKQKNDTFKWLIGSLIALIGASGGIAGIITLLNYIYPPANNDPNKPPIVIKSQPSASPESSPPPKSETPISTPLPQKEVCDVAGTVYDQDQNNNPIPNVTVWLTDGKNNETRLNTTGVDGKFEASCSQIAPDSFPQKLTLKGEGWAWGDGIPIPRGGQRNLNVYVSKRELNRIKVISTLGPKLVRPNVSPIPIDPGPVNGIRKRAVVLSNK